MTISWSDLVFDKSSSKCSKKSFRFEGLYIVPIKIGLVFVSSSSIKSTSSLCCCKSGRVEKAKSFLMWTQLTLSPLLDAAGMIILLHIRSPLLTLIFISVVFFPTSLAIGMHFQTLLSPLLKVEDGVAKFTSLVRAGD